MEDTVIMCEVYRSTLEMALPLIADAVKNAAFVGERQEIRVF